MGIDNSIIAFMLQEVSDITWIQAFRLMLHMFRTMLADNIDVENDKIEELVEAFMNALPALLRAKLQAV